jgi:undecaprenyl-diphosphatase
MLDMPAGRFFTVNVLSAMIWSPAYILPGFLFGASLGVAAEIAGRLALLLVVLLALLWFSWWLMRRLTRSLQPHARAIQLAILDRSRRNRVLYPLIASLLDPAHPEARGMTVLSGLLVIASFALLVIPANLTPDSLLGNLDLYLFGLLQELRTPLGDQLMIGVTSIGDGWVLYSFTALLGGWLVWRGRWRLSAHWLITVASVGLLTSLLKHGTRVPRPPLVDAAAMNYAYPSAHASLSVAVFGFLAVAVARELRDSWHWVPYSIAVFLIVGISFSRLYLGVHWLSDVLGGWSLGLMWVALMGIAYRQHPAPPLNARLFAPVAIGLLVLIAGIYNAQQFRDAERFYQAGTAEPVSITRTSWLQGDWRLPPTWRDDLEGLHHHPLNVQWLGSIDTLAAALRERGWRRPSRTNVKGWLAMLHGDAGIDALPVLPQVHHGQTQKLLLVRDIADAPQRLALRLWQTDFRDVDVRQPLWVGNATVLHVEDRFRLLRFLRTGSDFDTPLRLLQADTASLGQRLVRRDSGALAAGDITWNGNVLLLFSE